MDGNCVFDVRAKYFEWLYRIAVPGDIYSDYPMYSKMIQHLYDRKFSESTAYLVPNDSNRIADGIKLRLEFAEEEIGSNECLEFLDMDCSVLELLIGIARRMDDNIAISTSEDNTEDLFWELIENLNLDVFTDDRCSNGANKDRIDDIITVFCERLYCKDGRGGIFPLRNPPKDQVKTEIWYQMMAYLEENYPI